MVEIVKLNYKVANFKICLRYGLARSEMRTRKGVAPRLLKRLMFVVFCVWLRFVKCLCCWGGRFCHVTLAEIANVAAALLHLVSNDINPSPIWLSRCHFIRK